MFLLKYRIKIESFFELLHHLGLKSLAELPFETSELVKSLYFFLQTPFMLAAYMYLMSPFQNIVLVY